MKISLNWLKEHLDFNLTTEEVSELLTSTGLEVEGVEKVESIKGGLEGLVIGEVLTCEKHPDADKLSVTTVKVNSTDIFNIVCGAPNVKAGQKVVVATPGTTIFPIEGEPFKIKKAKIRGIESNGMICAEDEIGLGKDHNGIIVLPENTTVGVLVKDYYNVKSDEVFEIGLTPNRIDAASHLGVARDLRAVLLQRKNVNAIQKNQFLTVSNDNNEREIKVEINEADACHRYCSVTISNVIVQDSPGWLKEKLNAIGVRPINNIVDITNYVLHDLGQPLHAFDADEIKGEKIIVRNANANSSFITLDEVERKLDGTELMICDSESELCIAGIFGGLKSGVTEKTKTVFLESAWFNPSSIRKTAKKFGLSTDASFRFERGADIKMTMHALQKAAALIKEIAGGEISSKYNDVYPTPIKEVVLDLDFHSLNQIIGKEIDSKTIESILLSLDFKINSSSTNGLNISVPSYRVDVTRPIDVVEEILRIYGYNEIPLPEKMSSSLSFKDKNSSVETVELISNFISANGFHEIMTNSLTSSSQKEILNNNEESVKILNPLSSELDVLRESLLLNGLSAIAYNINRQQYDLRFYEFGKIYSKTSDKYVEQNFISLFLTGKKENENWNSSKSNVDIYTLVSVIEGLFNKLGVLDKVQKSKDSHVLLEQAISFTQGKNKIATLGLVNKKSLKYADIKQPVYVAEINFDLLFALIKKVKVEFKDLPKFPSTRRDLSLLLDAKVNFSEIENLARKIDKKLIKEVGLFDVYEGKNLETGKKSYAVSFVFYNEESTLTDKEVDQLMNKIIETLNKELGATLR